MTARFPRIRHGPEPFLRGIRIFHNVEHMDSIALGEFEQLVLMSIVRLDLDAYGATIRRDIETRTARRLSISAVYTTLDRLEQKGLVRSWVGEPTAERGGRRRKHFAIEPAGARALKTAYQDYMAMATGIDWTARRLKAE